MSTFSSSAPAPAPIPPRLSPLTSIELRLRQLEYLVSGRIASLPSFLSSSRSKPKRPDASDSPAGAGVDGILRHVMTIQSELEKAIEGRSSLERFMDDFEANLPFLSPHLTLGPSSSAFSPNAPPNPSTLPPLSKLSLILESESDILSAKRDLEHVEMLVDKRDVLGAGQLESHYGLTEELTKVVPIHRESLEAVSDLESRVVALLGRYDDYISGISQVFLELNSMLTKAEVEVSRMERAKRRKELVAGGA